MQFSLFVLLKNLVHGIYEDWMSWISFLSPPMLLHSCHSPEVVEKVSPPAPVALPPSIESQDISPTQLAGESIHPCNVYLGCTIVLIHVFAQKITFLYKYCNIDTPKVRISHLNARNFFSPSISILLSPLFFLWAYFKIIFLKHGGFKHFLLKRVTNTELKSEQTAQWNLIRSFVLFHLLLILLLNFIVIINPGSGEQNVSTFIGQNRPQQARD